MGDRATEIRELAPDLFMIRTGFPQIYLWRDGSEVTMIDAGFPGDEPALAAAFSELGFRTTALRRLVLTHHHEDHTGAAADVASWGDVEVVAHRADAPIIRGERRPPRRTLTDEERAVFERLSAGIPPAPPCRVDSEVEAGDVVAIGGGAAVISGAGHTEGSIGLLVRESRVLFTGDLIVTLSGGPTLGHFNDDAASARRSAAAMAAHDVLLLCPGHGDPVADPQVLRGLGAALESSAPGNL
ncbi:MULTISPECIES: MBL fold metallo-hydrolase [Streptomyces]|uniref:MBL fold metallo-hydrolase n=1 Tax=Streptomyces coacervatus TaxID=647381 RepID=A0ABP7JC67_9ACTN|nr:MBL fold metallo-hydrolase [Streptomyces coacervatus]MDF2264237.1 MBL fold metallo-hydrolase [Streptomyces coacervatus]